MAVKKGHTRITITLGDEVLKCLEGIKPLHPNMTKSQIVENAIIAYSTAVVEHYESIKEKEIKSNE